MQATTFQSFDTTRLLLQKWSNCDAPQRVFICQHGFCGAAEDFSGLATQVLAELPDTTLYAHNLRGMGYDPVKNRRGDIEHADYWQRDLIALTQHIRSLHPHARIIWCAESLGAIIACHAMTAAKNAEHLCDTLVLLSPVVAIGQQTARWKILLAYAAATLAPNFRLNLDFFTQGKSVQVTQRAEDHSVQSATNQWHVESFTLRQLKAIASLIASMPTAARAIHCPTLVFNGGMDFFTPTATLSDWLKHFPETTDLHHHCTPQAYHLLLYDVERSAIFQKMIDWIKG